MSCEIIRNKDTKEIERVLAPNGKDSKLFSDIEKFVKNKEESLRLWAQVYTQKFKTWFGDWEKDPKNSSKVVDDNGEPMILYHGTNANFLSFDKKFYESGSSEYFYFGEKGKPGLKTFAKNLIPVFLNIKNPNLFINNNENKVSNSDGFIENYTTDYINSLSESQYEQGEFLTQYGIKNSNQVKSVFNKGSFLTEEDSVSLRPVYESDVQTTFYIANEGIEVGKIITTNDGTYLNIAASSVESTGNNIGTYAYIKLAEIAKQMGLQLRSDSKLSESSTKLWQRFESAKEAIKAGNRYIFVGDGSNLINNIYRQVEDFSDVLYNQQDEILNPKPEDSEYVKLLNKLSKKFNISWEIDNDMPEIGRFENGVVKINFNKIQPDTPFHEFAHPFIELIKTENPILYKSLASKAKSIVYNGKTIEQKVKDLGYASEDVESESIVVALGLVAAGKLKESLDSDILKERLRAFFTKLVQALNSLFNKTLNVKDINPNTSFKELSDLLFESDIKLDLSSVSDKLFFQKSESAWNILKQLRQDVVLRESDHTYIAKGKEVKDSVHSAIVDPYYQSLFGNMVKSKAQSQSDTELKEQGTKIHLDAQAIGLRYVDPNTGFLRTNTLAKPDKVNTNEEIYSILETYLEKVFKSYPDKTRFSFEQPLHDAKLDRAGTVDLIILLPDGTAEIKDWKSLNPDSKTGKIEDVQWYKQEAYAKQLSEYRRMLETTLGTVVKKAMAIPIETGFERIFEPAIGEFVKSVKDTIRIGDTDFSKIPEEDAYLAPVVLRDYQTGFNDLDNLIQALYSILEATVNNGKKLESKNVKLNNLKKIIRDLQVRNDATSLLKSGSLLLANAKLQLDSPKLDISITNDLINELNIYGDLRTFFPVITRSELLDAEQEKLMSDLEGAARDIKKALENKRIALVQEVSNKFNIFNIAKAEKKIDFLKGMFKSLSTMSNRTIKTFYNLLVRGQQNRDVYTKANLEVISDKLKDLKEWAASKGLSEMDAFKKLIHLDEDGNPTPKFISKYTRDFYLKRNEAIENSDTNWILSNTTFNQQEYEKDLKALIKYYEETETIYKDDPAANKKYKDDKIANFVSRYAIKTGNNSNANAILNKENKYLSPLDKFESSEWKYLTSPENVKLKNFYDELIKINQKAQKLGMIKGYNFIPAIRTSMLEQLAQREGLGALNFSQWMEDLKVKSEEGFGEINKSTGKKIDKIPVYFKELMGEPIKDDTGKIIKYDYSKQSFDLAKVFGSWAAHVYDYQMKSELEDISQALISIEKNKKSIATNKYGTAMKKNGELEYVDDNSVNTKVLEDYVKYYVYGQAEYSNYDAKIFGVSAVKLGKKAVGWMSHKTLGLNVTSAFSNLFGGTSNAYLQAVKGGQFNKSDWASSIMDLTGRNEKAIALLNLLDPLMENVNTNRINDLSITAATKIFTTEHLYTLMRGSDKAVQFPVTVAITKNYMIDKGELINIKDYVRKEMNYSIQNKTFEEIKKLDKEVEERVEKLKETDSIFVKASVANDKLNTELTGENLGKLRAIIRKTNKSILGNTSKDDTNRAKLTFLGMFGMQFRNWMPQMVTERFGAAEMDSDLNLLTYGKTAQFFNFIGSKNFLNLGKELILGFGDHTLSRMKEEYERLLQEHIDGGGEKEEFVTIEQFKDMYIGNLKSQLQEFAMLFGIISLGFALASVPPEDRKSGLYKTVMKAMGKINNELTFFYNPLSATELINKPFPVVSLVTDAMQLVRHSFMEGFYYTIDDEKGMKKAKPMKYLFKEVPILKEGMNWMAAFDDDFRKENDIKIIY